MGFGFDAVQDSHIQLVQHGCTTVHLQKINLQIFLKLQVIRKFIKGKRIQSVVVRGSDFSGNSCCPFCSYVS